MLQNWFILLPELTFATFLPVAWLINHYRETKTAKTFYTLSKFFLLFALLFTIIFYNKSVWPTIWENSRYTTLFKVSVYLVAFVWFYLSSKWFLNKNRSSYVFYNSAIYSLLLFGILLSARNLLVPTICVPLLCILTVVLVMQHWDTEKVYQVVKLYGAFALLSVILLWVGCLILKKDIGNLSYSGIQEFLSQTPSVKISTYIAVTLVLSSLLFMCGAAPFHFWYTEIIGVAILPVCGFITLIPPFVYLSCLISLMTGAFSPLVEDLRPLLLSFAFVSMGFGAISANGQTHIRRLFAYSSVYNFGLMLLGIISFSSISVVGGFVHTIIYVMAMAGIYTSFLGLKSKGEYLCEISSINGLSEVKPYISTATVLFMISLIGVPPLLGFWGRLSLINTLVTEERWLDAGLFFIALIFMTNAFLRVIRSIYFEPLQNSFDRTDKSIYICLFINLVLVLISIFNPAYLLHDAQIVLSGVN